MHGSQAHESGRGGEGAVARAGLAHGAQVAEVYGGPGRPSRRRGGLEARRGVNSGEQHGRVEEEAGALAGALGAKGELRGVGHEGAAPRGAGSARQEAAVVGAAVGQGGRVGSQHEAPVGRPVDGAQPTLGPCRLRPALRVVGAPVVGFSAAPLPWPDPVHEELQAGAHT